MKEVTEEVVVAEADVTVPSATASAKKGFRKVKGKAYAKGSKIFRDYTRGCHKGKARNRPCVSQILSSCQERVTKHREMVADAKRIRQASHKE